jgi:hypothetical protein
MTVVRISFEAACGVRRAEDSGRAWPIEDLGATS